MENKELVEKVEKIADELVKRQDAAALELKAHGEVSKKTADAVKALETQLGEMKVKIERNIVPGMGETKLTKNIGQGFTESKAYKDMIASGNYESARWEVKEIVSGDPTSAGGLLVPQRVPGIITEPEVALRIRDLLAQGATGSNAIEYVRETLFTNAAAAVAESRQGSLVDKPESILRFDKETATVGTIAHWIPASRQIIADAGQLQGYINQRLTYGLKLVEDQTLADAIVSLAQVFDASILIDLGVTNITRLDIIRAAILQARRAQYPVSGVVLNPEDWAAIELLKDSQYRYIWVNVSDGGVARLWRVAVVESDAIDAGTFLVGAFSLGAQIWDREGVNIRVSEHHASYFIQNLVAILCEERLALTVYRPQAFVAGPFVAGS